MSDPHPLRKYRLAKRLTLDQVAVALGVDRSTVWRWESGERDLTANVMRQIVAFTEGEVTPEALIEFRPLPREPHRSRREAAEGSPEA
ncbi:hypothetical protein DLJ53_18155 [Acuticoccus sediminis]|uniref:HTH cro/C1-type domain-containing protein n=1 Tax=Acuticoccus sediminis TaxID=2184697 RepID=A0A8B2NS68_9HYPH|nr:helix-turn-helix transcriptional regulator [Acuticoccus sediminis]RAI01140.1 hypothetical protein DLJ53_18155 [Acuticoccus sediminis]